MSTREVQYRLRKILLMIVYESFRFITNKILQQAAISFVASLTSTRVPLDKIQIVFSHLGME